MNSLGRPPLMAEGTQNMLCAVLAGAVVVGLAANTLLGLWWLDPAIALLIAAACVREDQKAWRGEECGLRELRVTPGICARGVSR